MLEFFVGLVTEGLWPVFSALLSFLPVVVVLLTVVSLFENSGFVLGFGCTTLAISANGDNKKLARFLTFIPCSAKLPVLAFVCTLILGWSVFGVIFLYLFSIFVGLLLGGYQVIACPKLRVTSVFGIAKNIGVNTLEFLKRISVGLVVAASALYTLQYFGWLLPVASIFEPIFMPIGLANAAVIACLFFGLVAKEMIIGAILSFGVANLGLTTASALSFLIFVLLYTPCMPSLVALKNKYGLGYAVRQAGFNFAVAYLCSFFVYNLVALV